jgi:enoyl-CoA hydratase
VTVVERTTKEPVQYDVSEEVATIALNRPEAANAQNAELLPELNLRWTAAADDPDVRVIVLRGNEKHFSAGHDIKTVNTTESERWTVARVYAAESRQYLGYSLRWRNIPKPSIAAVQGVCIAGGLLLAWLCDLIIAADDAMFSDPVALMGIGGVEYHGHTSTTTVIFDRPSQNLEWTGSRSRRARASWPRAKL